MVDMVKRPSRYPIPQTTPYNAENFHSCTLFKIDFVIFECLQRAHVHKTEKRRKQSFSDVMIQMTIERS
jgi:hypothetical protein